MYVEPGTGDKWLPKECHFTGDGEYQQDGSVLCIYYETSNHCHHCHFNEDACMTEKDGHGASST